MTTDPVEPVDPYARSEYVEHASLDFHVDVIGRATDIVRTLALVAMAISLIVIAVALN